MKNLVFHVSTLAFSTIFMVCANISELSKKAESVLFTKAIAEDAN